MRVNDYFAPVRGPAAQLATVTASRAGVVAAQGQDSTEGLPLFAPAGVVYLPAEGEQVLLLPFEDGYICVGALCRTEGLAAGELVLKSAGGACIRLQNNGEVVINSLRVTPDGQLISEKGGG